MGASSGAGAPIQSSQYSGNAAGLLGPGASSSQVYGVPWQTLLSGSAYQDPRQAAAMRFYSPPPIEPIMQQIAALQQRAAMPPQWWLDSLGGQSGGFTGQPMSGSDLSTLLGARKSMSPAGQLAAMRRLSGE